MSIYLVRFIFAFLFFAVGAAWFIWALRNPLKIGMVGLSFFSFCVQFFLGIILFPLGLWVYGELDAADIALAFATIYAFWVGAWVTALLWRTPLRYVDVVQNPGVGTGRGIFANLAEVSLRINDSTLVGFYILLLVVRFGFMIKYGLGVSGLYTEEVVLGMPYWVYSIWVPFYLVGIVFGFVCLLRLLARQGSGLSNVLILLTEVLYNFTQGRRPMFMVVLLLLFAAVVWQGRVRWRHVLMGAAGAVFAWNFIFPIFFFMRFEWQVGRRDVLGMMATAVRRSVTDREVYSRNIEDRLLNALRVNYLIASRLRHGSPKLNGEFLKLAMFAGVPRALYPQKLAYQISADKVLDDHYGLFVYSGDIISNLPIFALADFGWAGGFIYGSLFVVALRFVEMILKLLSARSPTGFLVCFSIIAACPVLQMELTANDLVYNVRSILIFFVFFYTWGFLFGGRSEASAKLSNELIVDRQMQEQLT